MGMMRLSEINKMIANRVGMGMPHNIGINNPKGKDKEVNPMLEKMGHEMKVNPPKILAKTKKKFGAKRAEKQRKAILLSKAGMSKK